MDQLLEVRWQDSPVAVVQLLSDNRVEVLWIPLWDTEGERRVLNAGPCGNKDKDTREGGRRKW